MVKASQNIKPEALYDHLSWKLKDGQIHYIDKHRSPEDSQGRD